MKNPSLFARLPFWFGMPRKVQFSDSEAALLLGFLGRESECIKMFRFSENKKHEDVVNSLIDKLSGDVPVGVK